METIIGEILSLKQQNDTSKLSIMRMQPIVKVAMLLCLISLNDKLSAQEDRKVYIQPEVSVGYTLKGKLNIGFNIDAALRNPAIEKDNYGLSFNYRIMKFDKKLFKHSSLNLFYENDYSDLKVGLGSTKVKYGYRGIKTCYIVGWTSDISFRHPSITGPKIGFNSFHLNYRNTSFFPGSLHTPYLAYEYTPKPYLP